MYQHRQLLKQLEALDFTGRGEAFVESRFLTPLLECLGYEAHEDYEVVRHGDDGSAFKLQYPPVERGAIKVKHYNPDYVPTIRKKLFWIIEAKSPKDITYPFDDRYLVQGLQYCIHPEIQAKYLLVSNGRDSAVYDAHGAVFLEKDIYEPILEFSSAELEKRWPEVYELLSVEKLRTRIEADLKTMYDKLCLSSLDKNYPAHLIRQIGISQRENAREIERHVLTLHRNADDKHTIAWRAEMEQASAEQVFARMDMPWRAGGCEGEYFAIKSLAAGKPPAELLTQLTSDFDQQCIFRKEQTFVAVCLLWNKIGDDATKATMQAFFDRYRDAELPLLNQVECGFLRLVRKTAILSLYPKLRMTIDEQLRSAPELVRFVRPPTALDLTYSAEVFLHQTTFEQLKGLSQPQLEQQLREILRMENAIEEDYREARSKLTGWEKQMVGAAFETYGVGGKHYTFKNVLINFGIDQRDVPVPAIARTPIT